jgi:hypothetical protein
MVWLRRATSALAFLLASPAFAAAAPVASIPGDFILDMRLRSESVDQDGFSKNAEGVTLRTRLGYETPSWNGFKALVEGENTTALVEDYNSTVNGKIRYPIIADPENTELNRAQVSWTGHDGDIVAGRQRIILGNSRFVGNSGFRQNEQTFDAVKTSFRPVGGLTVTYGYLFQVHRIYGDEHGGQGRWNSDSHLFQADLKTPVGLLTGYGYLMAFDNDRPEFRAATRAQSNATWGARFAGAHPIQPGLAVTYEAEYAHQTDYRNDPTKFDLDYLDLAAGLKARSAWASVNMERLDGDGRRGFTTPIATLHIYQGWADVFLTTPANGVRDIYLKAGGLLPVGSPHHPLKLGAEAHDFTERDGAHRYGRELDLLASLPINPNLTAELKGAYFDGQRPGFADRTKLWVTLEYKR